MVQVIFSDVDGTLLNSRHQLTPLNRTVIQAVQRQGVPFVIVSARSPSGVATILRENGLRCPVVCYSGALMLDESGALLFHQGFSAQEARRILRFVEKKMDGPDNYVIYGSQSDSRAEIHVHGGGKEAV